MQAASRVLVARGKHEPQEMENPDVIWAGRAGEGVWAPTRDGQRIHIGIDCAAPDQLPTILRPSLRVFVDIEAAADIVAQTTEGGVRLLTVVHGPDAPTEFRFAVRLAEGLALDGMPSGGYDVVHTRFGATVGRFYNPWASDAMFRPVKADYRLEGATIVMRVEHQGSDYPVVADPFYSR